MTVTVINADVMDGLRAMADESVHCVVTSPPYWGLRDYGTGRWEGGDPNCDHVKGELRRGCNLADSPASTRGGGKKAAKITQIQYGDECGKCRARRVDEQIGLEPTLQDHIAKLVEVFREVRRVLRADGTLWLNYGDAYANDGKWGGETGGKQAYLDDASRKRCGREKRKTGLKPKDLIGMPWRLAFALQDDGWWLRRDIIWHKTNAMPESVHDRPATAHEYLFLLTKAARYSYDAEAIKEPVTGNAHARGDGINAKIKVPSGWDTKPGAHGKVHREGRSAPEYRARQNPSFSGAINGLVETRNKRSVWEVALDGYEGAHFATFPPALIEPCIKAGCPVGGTVLDPFGGAGTTGLVADRLQRDAILIELNPEYAAMAERRIRDDRGELLHYLEQTA